MRYRYKQADIGDREKLISLFTAFQPDWVFHLASGLRDDAPLDLCRINVEGATALTQALIDSGWRPQLVIYGSSGGVYGLPQRLPLDEEAPTQAHDFYSSTKLAGEQFTRILTRGHDIPAVWARLFNLVGPGQDERHVCGYFASRIAAIAAGEVSLALTVGPLEPTRDFIDVRDAASALVLLARHGTAGLVYNIASGHGVAIGDVLTILLRLAGLEGQVLISQDGARKADILHHVADIHRLRALGFTPQFTLAQSLDDLLDYYAYTVRPVEVSSC
jgi:GDP-4-dehydro-6-deoxy-D-mannose reductase